MKRGLILLALLLASCATVKPPTRPVAYLFPTVTTMGDVQSTLKARPCTPEQITRVLDIVDEKHLFRSAGLLDADIAILARGISTRGYAELDARRTKCPYRWAAFACLPQGGLLVRLPLGQLGKPNSKSNLSDTEEYRSQYLQEHFPALCKSGAKIHWKRNANYHGDKPDFNNLFFTWELFALFPLELWN